MTVRDKLPVLNKHPLPERKPARLLAVFAHPDDETFRAGGTLALLGRGGIQVQVVTATRGEAGSCGDPPLCAPEALPALREAELRCACQSLGVEPPIVLGYPDGGLAQSNTERMLGEIIFILRTFQPQVMLSFGPDGLSGHPDHIAIGRAALDAYLQSPQVAALYTLAVPASFVEALNLGQLTPVPDEDIALAVDVSPAWETKKAAICCHASQLSSTPMLQAPEAPRQLFFGREYFVKAAERRPDANFIPEAIKDCLIGAG